MSYELPDFNALLAGSGSIQSALTIFDADYSLKEQENFAPLTFPTLQALSINLQSITPQVKPAFLTWIKDMAHLEQLFLRGIAPHLNSLGEGGYRPLACEIALQNQRLRYLKLDKFSWRIWHDGELDGKKSCHLEKLDRFEEREIDAFQTKPSFWFYEY